MALGPLLFVALTLASQCAAHKRNIQLPDVWYHDSDHPVHDLFRRQTTGLEVGSPAWAAHFPNDKPDISQLPDEWVYALSNAIAAGKIPDIPVTTMPDPNSTEGVPIYPNGLAATSKEICSSTAQCYNAPMGDIWEAPPNVYATGFDDGPTPFSPILLDFLKKQNDHITHFVIGKAIKLNPKEFIAIRDSGDDIAVHTYTHVHMTTLTNLELVAEFGWSLELIRASTGGKIPKFWRPPYGDSDNRVRAIAFEVFGMKSMLWNKDTNDWKLLAGGEAAMKELNATFAQWATGPKSPGLMVLEHETTNQSIQCFIAAYPVMKANGWTVTSAARLANTGGSTGAYRTASQTAVLATGVNTTSHQISRALQTSLSGASDNTTGTTGGNGAQSVAVSMSLLVAFLGVALSLA